MITHVVRSAAVIACAERHGGRVLTNDRRHFPIVARGERSIIVVYRRAGVIFQPAYPPGPVRVGVALLGGRTIHIPTSVNDSTVPASPSTVIR